MVAVTDEEEVPVMIQEPLDINFIEPTRLSPAVTWRGLVYTALPVESTNQLATAQKAPRDGKGKQKEEGRKEKKETENSKGEIPPPA